MLGFTLPLLRPRDEADVDAPKDPLAIARLLCAPSFTDLIKRALDCAEKERSRVAVVRSSYESFCDKDGEFAYVDIPVEMKSRNIETLLRKLYPDLPEARSLDELLQDESGYCCPVRKFQKNKHKHKNNPSKFNKKERSFVDFCFFLKIINFILPLYCLK